MNNQPPWLERPMTDDGLRVSQKNVLNFDLEWPFHFHFIILKLIFILKSDIIGKRNDCSCKVQLIVIVLMSNKCILYLYIIYEF